MKILTLKDFKNRFGSLHLLLKKVFVFHERNVLIKQFGTYITEFFSFKKHRGELIPTVSNTVAQAHSEFLSSQFKEVITFVLARGVESENNALLSNM